MGVKECGKMEDFLEFLDWMGESRNIDGVGSGGCQRVEDTECGSSGGFKRMEDTDCGRSEDQRS